MKQLRIVRLALAALLPAIVTAQIASSEADQMKWKIVGMGGYFGDVWKDFFNHQPHAYLAPKITWYTGKIQSACGELGPDNASYCYRDNTVYCELNFLLEQKHEASRALKSSGAYAPIVILAHEWGHAVEYWFMSGKDWAFSTLQHEQLADCLAGVVTAAAERAGKATRSDVAEAEYSLRSASFFNYKRYASAGILPVPPETPWDKFQKHETHGEADDRIRAFRTGLGGTASSCLEGVRAGGYLK